MTNMINSADIQLQASTMQRQQAHLLAAKGKLKESAGLDMDKINAAAKDFEAMFLTEMMRPMFEGIKPDPMFGGGKGEEVFQSMMLEEYGKSMVDAGGIGLAKHIKAEMIRIQEEMQQ